MRSNGRTIKGRSQTFLTFVSYMKEHNGRESIEIIIYTVHIEDATNPFQI
jgi:hypothetical protein